MPADSSTADPCPAVAVPDTCPGIFGVWIVSYFAHGRRVHANTYLFERATKVVG